jgi:putative protease
MYAIIQNPFIFFINKIYIYNNIQFKMVVKKKETKSKETPIGVVSNYFDHVSVAAIKLKTGLKKGDKIRVVGGKMDFEQTVDSMQIQHKAVSEAKKGDEIGIKLKEKVRKGYRVFKK